MIKVAAVKDESSHWYVIPLEMKEDFHKLNEIIVNNEKGYLWEEEFNEKFSKYRTGGDLNNIQLYANI